VFVPSGVAGIGSESGEAPGDGRLIRTPPSYDGAGNDVRGFDRVKKFARTAAVRRRKAKDQSENGKGKKGKVKNG
jgi:hypothetical protein